MTTGYRKGAWLIWLMLPVYLVLAALLPVADDEVYYWSWARPLQFSYYDHPPLTAYMIRLSTDLFGNTVFGFRVPACLAIAFVLAVVVRLTRPQSLVPWVAFTPLFTLGAVLITPDAPLLMAWAAYTWWLAEVHRRLTPSSNEPDDPEVGVGVPWWLWMLGGVILGGGVLGKYTMALAVPSGFASFLVIRHLWRRWLPGYIAHGVVSFVVASPILIHNIQHDFVPLLFQWRHSMGHSQPGWRPFGEFVGVQILLFGTLPFFLLPWVVWNFRRLCENSRLRACACLYLIPISFFLYKATRAPLQGNWALVAFVSFWPLAAVWYESVRKSAFWRWSTASAFFVPAASVLVLAVHLIRPLPVIPIEGDRITRQYAVDEAIRKIAGVIRDRGDQLPVYAPSYQLTAWLRFQSLDSRQIDKLTRPSHFTQRPESATDSDRAYVVSEYPLPPEFTVGFDPPEVIARFPLMVRGSKVSEYQLLLYTKAEIAQQEPSQIERVSFVDDPPQTKATEPPSSKATKIIRKILAADNDQSKAKR